MDLMELKKEFKTTRTTFSPVEVVNHLNIADLNEKMKAREKVKKLNDILKSKMTVPTGVAFVYTGQ